jgi:hypothetical protein
MTIGGADPSSVRQPGDAEQPDGRDPGDENDGDADQLGSHAETPTVLSRDDISPVPVAIFARRRRPRQALPW